MRNILRRLDEAGIVETYATPAPGYDPGYGTPIVMLPNPNKLYDRFVESTKTREEIVEAPPLETPGHLERVVHTDIDALVEEAVAARAVAVDGRLLLR
jgi:hypothetical protein